MAVKILGVKKSYDGTAVLNIPALTLPDRGIFGICGPSGSGKTTLLRLIAGLEKPDCGEIKGISGKKISCLFQEDRLLPHLTALQNVALVCDKSSALNMLARVGLEQHIDKYPAEMSGGMQRRVAFARAAAFGGDILLLDEPFEGLDADLRETIFSIIREESKKNLVVLVTHNLTPAQDKYESFYLQI